MKLYELNRVRNFSTTHGNRREYEPCGWTSSLEELHKMAEEENKIDEKNEDYGCYYSVSIYGGYKEDNGFTDLTDFICAIPYSDDIY